MREYSPGRSVTHLDADALVIAPSGRALLAHVSICVPLSRCLEQARNSINNQNPSVLIFILSGAPVPYKSANLAIERSGGDRRSSDCGVRALVTWLKAIRDTGRRRAGCSGR